MHYIRKYKVFLIHNSKFFIKLTQKQFLNLLSNYNLTNQICLLSKFFWETSAPILIIPKANMWPFDSWRFLNRFNNFFLAGYGQKLGICEKKLNLCMCPPCDMCMCPPISLSKFVHVSPCFFVHIYACVPALTLVDNFSYQRRAKAGRRPAQQRVNRESSSRTTTT